MKLLLNCSIFCALLLLSITYVNSQDTIEREAERQPAENDKKSRLFETTKRNNQLAGLSKFGINTSNEVKRTEIPSEETITARQFSGGTGTETDPYQISSIAQLKELRNDASYFAAYFQLSNRLSFTNSDYEDGVKKWRPIGSSTNPFTGSFDGNGHEIENLEINRSSEDNIGLFGKIRGGVLKNFRLENANIIGRSSVGSLVGDLENGVVQSSTVGLIHEVSVAGTATSGGIGGLIGRAESSSINQTHTSVNIVETHGIAGGLVGHGINTVVSLAVVNLFLNTTGQESRISNLRALGGLAGYTEGSFNVSNALVNAYMEFTTTSNFFTSGLIAEVSGDLRIDEVQVSIAYNCVKPVLSGLFGALGSFNFFINNLHASISIEKDPGGNFRGFAEDRNGGAVKNSYLFFDPKFDASDTARFFPLYPNAGSNPVLNGSDFYFTFNPNQRVIDFGNAEVTYKPFAEFTTNVGLFTNWDTVNVWNVGGGELPSLRWVTEFLFTDNLIISSIDDFSYQPMENPELSWQVAGAISGTASLYLDGILISGVDWSLLVPAVFSLDDFTGLVSGTTYNITVEAIAVGSRVTDTVFVTVIAGLSITEPADGSYTIGAIGNTLKWLSGAVGNSGNVTLYRAGIRINESNWEGQRLFSYSIDGLSVGIHEFRLELVDSLNLSISDTVIITVNPETFTLSSPVDQLLDVSVVEKALLWSVISAGNSGTATLFQDGSFLRQTVNWNSSTELVFNISDISAGNFEFMLSVMDAVGNTRVDKVQVRVTSYPQFTVAEQQFEQSSVGNLLNWTISSVTNSGTFTLFQDGVVVSSGQWSGAQSFTQNVDALATGSYNFTVLSTDSFGTQVSSSLLVRVVLPGFSISSPSDLSYSSGATGNSISWTVSNSSGRSGNATFLRNDVPFGEVQDWSSLSNSSVTITVVVDGLQAGSHILDIELRDSSGVKLEDSVTITVMEVFNIFSPPAATTRSSSTQGSASFLSGFLIFLIIGEVVAIVGISGFVVYLALKLTKKRNVSKIATGSAPKKKSS